MVRGLLRVWGASCAPPAGSGASPGEKWISVLTKSHRMPVVETFVVN